MLYDMGVETDIEINTDASAAKGIASRKGVGRVRHVEVHQLWVQEKVSKGEIVIHKVKGEDNIADILTKFVDREKIDKAIKSAGLERRGGRHDIMPQLE